MKLIRIFALSAVVFYLTQENETDALIARMIEGGVNLAVDTAVKLIEIPIMIGGKIIWKTFKVNAKFVWDLTKIPFKVIFRLAWRFSKKPLKKITPKFIQDALREEVSKYKLRNKLRKQKKSKVHRFKTAIKTKAKNWELNHKLRKLKYKNKYAKK